MITATLMMSRGCSIFNVGAEKQYNEATACYVVRIYIFTLERIRNKKEID